MAKIWFTFLLVAINIRLPLAVIPKDFDADFWTNEKNQQLINLFIEKKGNERKMQFAWRKDPSNSKQKYFPQMKYQVGRLMKAGRIRANGKHWDKWVPHHNKFLPHEEMELMKIWYNEYKGTGSKSASVIYDAWKRDHPEDTDKKPKLLLKRVNKLLEDTFVIPHSHTGRGDIVLNLALKSKRDYLAMMKKDLNITPIPTIPSSDQRSDRGDIEIGSQSTHSVSTKNHTVSHQKLLSLFPEHPGI